MNSRTHLNNDQFISYVYKMLDDARREVFNRHLAECAVCRAMLAEHERFQHRIENELKAEINGNSSSPGMSFAQISPRLQRRRTFWQHFSVAIPLVAASLGLALTLVGVWQTLVGSYPFQIDPGRPFAAPLPALACFFFMFVSMDQYDRSISLRPRFIFTIILSLILWIGSSLLGLLNIIVIRDLTIAAVIFTGGNPAGASVVAILTIMLAAMVVIGVIIGGAEFHYKHLGQPRSWKLFVWTIAIQLLIMVLPYILL